MHIDFGVLSIFSAYSGYKCALITINPIEYHQYCHMQYATLICRSVVCHLFNKMRYSFKDRLFPVELPEEIEDMIFMFTYNQSRAELHYSANRAKQTSLLMPVPPRWKNLITQGRFNWTKYLAGDHIIDIEAVKVAVRYVNWHCLRSKKCPIAKFAQISTKISFLLR